MFSFAVRKKKTDTVRYVRRLSDLTTPNMGTMGELSREENRYNRTLPALLCPWEREQAVVEECAFVLTRDLSDHGIGLTLNAPFTAEDALLGFWLPSDEMSEPWFFVSRTRRLTPMGGGFWSLGVELVEFANPNYGEQLEILKPVALHLLPHGRAGSFG